MKMSFWSGSLALLLFVVPAQGAPAQKDKPLVLYPACPCYQAIGDGNGETRIDARLNIEPERRAGMRLAVELMDANGKQLQTATADASKGEFVGVDLRVPNQSPAAFAVRTRLLDSAGQEVAEASTDIHVIQRGDAMVKMGPDGFLRVAGKPEFPIGMYSASKFDEMGKAGFNTTHSYAVTLGETNELINATDVRLKQLLDNSWSNGMRMMVELPRKPIEKAQWQSVTRRILTFRHHPGLLCWGSEERVARGAAPLTNMAMLYRLLKELDPDHPLVLGDTKEKIQKLQTDRRDFFPDPCMDAGIWWWYPIPPRPAQTNALEGQEKTAELLLQPPSWLTTTISKKPLWIAIQSYQKPAKDARFPTPEEYRCQAYLSIINGVKGLFFYTGSGQKDSDGKPAGLLNKQIEGHWDYVKQLVGELREFSAVIMASVSSSKVSMSPADAPVEFTTRELERKGYLIAANKSGKPQRVRFSSGMLDGKHVEVLYENRQARIQGDVLTDEFEPFGVRVYRIE
jgi:hypothetical protein